MPSARCKGERKGTKGSSEIAGRASEADDSVPEAAGRVSEGAGRVSEVAGRCLEGARRAFGGAGRNMLDQTIPRWAKRFSSVSVLILVRFT